MGKKASRATGKRKAKKLSPSDRFSEYDRFKEYAGAQYTGMRVGRTHKWYYDKGTWKEKKVTPEKWQISFEVVKRRAGKAPEGSGVPVGTEYHWFILAHQHARKQDANNYTTELNGLKFKIAHKRFDKDKWSGSETAQRKHLIRILREFIVQLEHEPFPVDGLPFPDVKPVKKIKRAKKTLV